MKGFTKIVATIGPASDSVRTIRELYDAGMSVARLNFSHGSYDYFQKVISNIRAVSNEIAIMLDTKGPEIRTGKGKPIELAEGQLILLSSKHKESDSKKIVIEYPFLDELGKESEILLDEGLIELKFVKRQKDGILARVVRGGIITAARKVTLRNHHQRLPFLSKKDKEDILFGVRNNVDFISASFIRNAGDVRQLRKMLGRKGSGIRIIAKIENPEAVSNVEQILKESDGLMVARGDLGVEMPLEKVPKIQEKIIRLCNKYGQPVVVATQMLESMNENSRPTRAEVSDVANAAMQGADAVMLSGETATGKHPVLALKTMASIVNEHAQMAEGSSQVNTAEISDKLLRLRIGLYVTNAAALACKVLNIKAIIAHTSSGFTARKMSMFRPNCPIIAFTRHYKVLRQLQLSRGVFPYIVKRHFSSLCGKERYFVMKCLEKSLISKEDLVVLVSGNHSAGIPYTNLVEIIPVADIIKSNARK